MKRQLPNLCASRVRAAIVAFAATLLALPASAATSFPDYPLQTGVDSVPPNVMFILDNSGSMALISMPTLDEAFDVQPEDYSGTDTGDNQTGLNDDPHDRSYLNNSVYYDPHTSYDPWLTADGSTRLTGGTTVDAVYKSWNLASGDTRDIRDSEHSIFYVPHAGVAPSTNPDPDDYDKYWVRNNGGTAEVVREVISGSLGSWANVDIDEQQWWRDTVTVPAGTDSLTIAVAGGSGRGDVDLYVRRGADPTTSSNDGNSESSDNEESVTIFDPQAGVWHIGAYNVASGSGNRTVSGNTISAAYNGAEVATPTGRSQAAELTNIATWYSYFRSRMKTAKAGASEAFAGLGRNFRVGFTPINGRSSDLSSDGTGTIIPVDINDGLFEDTVAGNNKTAWFNSLHGAVVESGSTPLRTALNAVGEYYTRDDDLGPWGPQATADQLTCRQSFAILTTDGYWNDGEDEKFGLVDEDGDGHSVTLADVAAHYYDTDLRGDLDDHVPGSASDTADWQHMVTFGVSIGLGGTLPITDPPPASDATIWPDPMDDENAERIDDLWHAAVNGHGKFIAAANADQFATALSSALGNITKRRASGSNVTSNGPQLNAGSRIFQATFTSGEWSGDVWSISIAGGGISGSASWSAAAVANAAPAAFLTRGVYTWDIANTDGAAFPTAAQQSSLARTGGGAPVTGADNASYLKGDRSKEIDNGGTLRTRTSPIGDIVNSSPFYSEETGALFIGANDGMLHAINSATGAVEFSYVPAGLDFTALADLSNPEYIHHFFVDGGIDVTTRAQGNDKNILVASLGRGGKGVFALDVTDPATFDQSDVLWDHTVGVDPDMGYVLGAPIVRKAHPSGATLAFVGNGIESVNGSSALFIYNAETGVLVDKIVVDPNGGGLAPPRAADTNLDGIADTIYAGDLSGQLWRFDITGSVAQWDDSYVKLFAAVDSANTAQPITAAVAIAREPVTDRIFVLFGTGQYVSVDDLDDTSTQTLYALIDEGVAIAGRTALHERTIPYTGTDSKGRAARAWEKYSPLPAGKKGWFVDLGIPTAGERVVTAPFMRGRALWFSSIIPQSGTGCDSGGTGYLNSVDAFTGTNPKLGSGTGTYIDVDGNGTGDDRLTGAPDGDAEGYYITSVDLGIGMLGQGTGVGGAIYACGSEAECGMVQTPPNTFGARRLGWRELFNRD